MIFEKQIIKMYEGMAYTRCDDIGVAYFYSFKDFNGLNKEVYKFSSSMGHNLQGYLYYYDNPIKDKLVVFDHGFGGGHRSYMKEIEVLCRKGFLVLAYDHTGCMESGGINPNGMAQSLHDLDDCINQVKKDPRFFNYELYVVGHSWGGFSTLNIASIHKDIKKIVVLSGFVSVELLINSYFSGILKGYRKVIMNIENTANPEYVNYNAVETLKNSNVDALLIYSSDDKMCKKNPHYDTLYNELKDLENITFKLVDNKGHNPNYTVDAVNYLNEYVVLKNKLLKQKNLTSIEKEKFVSSFDWDRMTQQDENIWRIIFEHLEK